MERWILNAEPSPTAMMTAINRLAATGLWANQASKRLMTGPPPPAPRGVAADPYLDPRRGLIAQVLHGVLQQVLDRLAEACPVHRDHW